MKVRQNKFMIDSFGLYIHVPFRIYKHNYSGTLSHFNMDFKIRPYFRALINELKLYKHKNYIIDSIYIGGGDPSYADETYIVDVLNYIYDNFNVLDNCEKTIEIIPTTPEYMIKAYIRAGINRFSIKVITFDKVGLENLDIEHDKFDIIQIVKILRRNNINNINFDMYFPYTGQTVDLVKSDLKYIEKLNIPHVSLYTLRTDEELIPKIEQQDKEDKLEFEILETVSEELTNIGYLHYEINHFAKTGYRSYHNIKYWNLNNFIGVGLGSGSFIDGVFYKNEIEFDKYFYSIKEGKLPYRIIEKWTKEDYEKNYIISKMGMIEGVSIQEFNKKFGIDFLTKYKSELDKFIKENVIEIKGDRVKFTKKGVYYSNRFYMEII